jgi:hypothetical protein
MGKRQRRKTREANPGRPAGKQKLGATGPYMVCGICNEPLATYSRVNPADEWQEQIITYVHSLEYTDTNGRVITSGKDYDHIAVPVEGTPVNADITCDFCHAPDPRFAFVPRRAIRMINPVGGPELDYSSPWASCDGCLQAVKNRNMTRIINRVFASPYSILREMSPDERPFYRAALRNFYAEYLKSDPAGPYEVKIRPAHVPFGKPGSRRGM